MRIRRIRVGPHDYDILWDAEAATGAAVNGALLNDVSKILLDPRLSAGQTRDTMLHEALHAIWKQTNLVLDYPDEDSTSPGEKLIAVLAPRILALIRDNPKLVEFLEEKD